MKTPTRTPFDQLPNRVRLLVNYANNLVGEFLTKRDDGYYTNDALWFRECEEVDLLLQAGWAEAVADRLPRLTDYHTTCLSIAYRDCVLENGHFYRVIKERLL